MSAIEVGAEFGPSSWIEVPQEKIQAFADTTDDHNFIHVDPEMAAQTPFGGTVAHGYLTLSLLPAMSYEVIPHDDPGAGSVRLARARKVSRRRGEARGLGPRDDHDGDDRARGRRQARLRRRGRVPVLPPLVWILDRCLLRPEGCNVLSLG